MYKIISTRKEIVSVKIYSAVKGGEAWLHLLSIP